MKNTNSWLLALVLALTSACAPALLALQPAIETPGAARVEVRDIKGGDIVRLQVYNLSPSTMVVDRNGFFLETPSGPRSRVEGGVGSVYTIPPGGSHAVNLRFSTRGIAKGSQLVISMPRAITIDGQLVPVQPLPVAAR